MKHLVFFILSSFLTISSFAQDKINFNGKILGSGGFVYNANVVNKKIYKGTVSDFQGNFSLPVSKNDTITFTCIGYKNFTYIIPDTVNSSSHRVIVTLVEDTILVREAVVTPWPVNTTQLKDAFLNEKDIEKEAISVYAGFREIEGEQREPDPTILNPISFIANVFSKKRIQKKKMEKFRRMLQEE